MLYCAFLWRRIPLFKPSHNQPANVSFSIIVPTRNEEANIAACVNGLLQQNYPEHLFEVIVVNDHSTDNTLRILQSIQAPNYSCINLAEQLQANEQVKAYKKKAIEKAIERSKHQWIVSTDADCLSHPRWLSDLAQFIQQQQPKLVAMPVLMSAHNIFERFQQFDFLSMQGITAVAVHFKLANMGNGANLAYQKSAFMAVEGFKQIDQIASGDDMLLMQKIDHAFGKSPITYLKSPACIVETTPEKSLSAFVQQRVRWASKSKHYSDVRLLGLLVLVYCTNVLLLLFSAYCIWQGRHYVWPILWVLKAASEYSLLGSVLNFYGLEKQHVKSGFLFLLLQPFHMLYIILSGFLGLFKHYEWKGRVSQ